MPAPDGTGGDTDITFTAGGRLHPNHLVHPVTAIAGARGGRGSETFVAYEFRREYLRGRTGERFQCNAADAETNISSGQQNKFA